MSSANQGLESSRILYRSMKITGTTCTIVALVAGIVVPDEDPPQEFPSIPLLRPNLTPLPTWTHLRSHLLTILVTHPRPCDGELYQKHLPRWRLYRLVQLRPQSSRALRSR